MLQWRFSLPETLARTEPMLDFPNSFKDLVFFQIFAGIKCKINDNLSKLFSYVKHDRRAFP